MLRLINLESHLFFHVRVAYKTRRFCSFLQNKPRMYRGCRPRACMYICRAGHKNPGCHYCRLGGVIPILTTYEYSMELIVLKLPRPF